MRMRRLWLVIGCFAATAACGGGGPGTVPKCLPTLSPTAHNYDTVLTDAQAWGCMVHP